MEEYLANAELENFLNSDMDHFEQVQRLGDIDDMVPLLNRQFDRAKRYADKPGTEIEIPYGQVLHIVEELRKYNQDNDFSSNAEGQLKIRAGEFLKSIIITLDEIHKEKMLLMTVIAKVKLEKE